jgi:hypothetical protein
MNDTIATNPNYTNEKILVQKSNNELATNTISEILATNTTFATTASVNTLLATKEDTNKKGVANGYASLGADGKVISSQLPTATAISLPSGEIDTITHNQKITTTLADIAGSTFVLPTAGTYYITVNMNVIPDGYANDARVNLCYSDNTSLPSSSIRLMATAAGFSVHGTMPSIITITAPTTLKLRGQCGSGSATINNDNFYGSCKIDWIKIG